MQISYSFLHALVSKLFGAQPSDAAFPDLAKRKNVLAQWLLGFVETGGPNNVTAANIDKIEGKGHGRRALGTPLVPYPFPIALHPV